MVDVHLPEAVPAVLGSDTPVPSTAKPPSRPPERPRIDGRLARSQRTIEHIVQALLDLLERDRGQDVVLDRRNGAKSGCGERQQGPEAPDRDGRPQPAGAPVPELSVQLKSSRPWPARHGTTRFRGIAPPSGTAGGLD